MCTKKYSLLQIAMLTLMRISIGWHFLYEGMYKYFSGDWTSKGYLLNSTGPLSSLFKECTKSAATLMIIDNLNIWGLILIGICLFVGLFEKPAKFFGIILLSLYYLSYPPFASLSQTFYGEGNYWIVDRNLMEILSLLVLMVFPSSPYVGVDRFLMNNKINKNNIFYKICFHKNYNKK